MKRSSVILSNKPIYKFRIHNSSRFNLRAFYDLSFNLSYV